MAFKIDERWYTIDGEKLPSVTTILSALHKPALLNWAVNEERKFFKEAMLEVLTHPDGKSPDEIWGVVESAATGLKQAEKLKKEAAEIGSQAHAMIEWKTRQMLGESQGDPPALSPPAERAYSAWLEWAEMVDLKPLKAEFTVFHKEKKYAGTLDLLSEVDFQVCVIDYKTGSKVWPEAFLQNIAYRQAASSMGFPSSKGIILRLPKKEGDTEFEAVEVPKWDGDFDDFLAVKRAWEWQKRDFDGRSGKVVQTMV